MSAETSQWLNTQTLIGHTDKRGNAWHYRAEMQGEESNHYPGAVPIDDVKRRLFGWDAQEATLTATIMDEMGVTTIADPTRKAIVRPVAALFPDDPGGIMGVFKSGYQMHQYREWLLDMLENLMDDGIGIGSAGLLAMGAKAWVSIEMPDTIVTPSGVAFRPNLLACTSHDGTLATTFQRVVTNVVCDNTMSAALGEKTAQKIKVKHSRYSSLKLQDARDAIGIIHSIGEDFAAQVEQLTNTVVSEGDWSAFLDAISPVPEQEGRAATMSENKRGELSTLWNSDERVLPWKGTAWGVVQCVNTYAHHVSNAHGGKNAERNTLRAVKGQIDALDTSTLATLTRVLQPA